MSFKAIYLSIDRLLRKAFKRLLFLHTHYGDGTSCQNGKADCQPDPEAFGPLVHLPEVLDPSETLPRSPVGHFAAAAKRCCGSTCRADSWSGKRVWHWMWLLGLLHDGA